MLHLSYYEIMIFYWELSFAAEGEDNAVTTVGLT